MWVGVDLKAIQNALMGGLMIIQNAPIGGFSRKRNALGGGGGGIPDQG